MQFGCESNMESKVNNFSRDSLTNLITKSYQYESSLNYSEMDREEVIRFNSINTNRWKSYADTVKKHSQRIYKSIYGNIRRDASSSKIDRREYIDILDNYFLSINSLDVEIPKVFENEFRLLASQVKIKENQNLSDNYYLDRLVCIVAYAEYELTLFFLNKLIPGCDLRQSSSSVLVGQSSQVVRKGGELIITAGVGTFSPVSSPKILINGKRIYLNEHALAEYRLRVSTLKGKYTVPVKIKYMNQDGEEVSQEFEIEYEVE